MNASEFEFWRWRLAHMQGGGFQSEHGLAPVAPPSGGTSAGTTCASTPSPSPSAPPLLLPGGEEARSAAADTLDLQPLDFAPLDRLRRVCFGEGFVSVRVDAGMSDEQCWFVLSDDDALELSGRIQARLGFAMGGPLIGLAMAALSGACAASAFHLLF